MVDDGWWTFKKRDVAIYAIYALNPGAHLYATEVKLKWTSGRISMDSESNLHKRSKLSNLRIDAEDLVEKITEVKRLELRDSTVIEKLGYPLRFLMIKPCPGISF